MSITRDQLPVMLRNRVEDDVAQWLMKQDFSQDWPVSVVRNIAREAGASAWSRGINLMTELSQ